MPAPTLFLDSDGVAHPADVYVTPCDIVLAAAGHELFERLPLMAEAFIAARRLQVVLSTQWAAVAGYRATLLKLPVALRKRVVCATTFGMDPRIWRKQTRYEQITGYAARTGIVAWVAIDDDAHGWPAEERHRLVLTDGATAMTAANADELAQRLRALP